MDSGRKSAALPRSESNRTLFDIIREEGGGSKESKKTWKSFKNKLHRNNSGGRGSTWTSTVPVPASDIPLTSNSGKRIMVRQPSTRMDPGTDHDPISQPDITAVYDAAPSLGRAPSLARANASGRFDVNNRGAIPTRRLQRESNSDEDEDDDDDEDYEETAEEVKETRPVRMSLMSLLAETDKDGFSYGMEDEEEDEEDYGGAGEYNNCCVCMVRHKGTPFVPCGHSFCRLCSRELCVQGGNCPLCNNYILEILDIF